MFDQTLSWVIDVWACLCFLEFFGVGGMVNPVQAVLRDTNRMEASNKAR